MHLCNRKISQCITLLIKNLLTVGMLRVLLNVYLLAVAVFEVEWRSDRLCVLRKCFLGIFSGPLPYGLASRPLKVSQSIKASFNILSSNNPQVANAIIITIYSVTPHSLRLNNNYFPSTLSDRSTIYHKLHNFTLPTKDDNNYTPRVLHRYTSSIVKL